MDEKQQADGGQLVTALRRRAPLIAVCAFLVAGSALVLSLVQTNVYSAEASLLFRDPGFDQRLFRSAGESWEDPAREAATNVALASLDTISELTADDLGGGLDGDDVSAKVNVESGGQSDVATIVAEDPDPEEAANLANTFAQNYIEFRRDADRAQVAGARELVEADFESLPAGERDSQAGESLQRQISQLQALEALQTGNAELVQEAEVPSSPSSPKPLRNAILGLLLGLLLGVGIALLRERLDRRLRAPSDFEDAFGLPVLTTIPDRKLLSKTDHDMERLLSSDAEAFRMLRTRLRYFNVGRDIRSVLVTSHTPGDGKTTVAWNLATSAAAAGVRTILVEADFHRPTVAEREELAPIPGLSELLSHQVSRDGAIQHSAVETGMNGGSAERALDVIVAGSYPPNAAELLESEGMADLLEHLTTEYELVVIDTPPISLLADAIPLLRMVNGVLVVGRLNKTTRDDAISLKGELEKLGAPALGVIANRAPSRGKRYGYYGYTANGGGPGGGAVERPVGAGTTAD